MTCPYR